MVCMAPRATYLSSYTLTYLYIYIRTYPYIWERQRGRSGITEGREGCKQRGMRVGEVLSSERGRKCGIEGGR